MNKSSIRFGLETYPDPEEPYIKSAIRSRQIKKEHSKASLRKVPSEILKISLNGKSTGSREHLEADVSKNTIRKLDLDSVHVESKIDPEDQSRQDHLTKHLLSDVGDSHQAQD